MPAVLTMGSLNVDHILTVATLPEPGETVLSRSYRVVAGGKGRNQAVAVAALGGRAALAGAVGADSSGEWLRSGLLADGVDDSLLVTIPGEPTGLAQITVDASGENTIVVHPGANGRVGPLDADHVELTAWQVLLCSLEIPVESVAESVAAARASGVRTVVNAAPMVGAGDGRLEAVLAHTDVLVVNRSEALDLVDPPAGVGLMVALKGCVTAGRPDTVVTLGAGGALLVSPDGVTSFPAHPVGVSSTVGAGDTFAGALSLGLAAGRGLADAVGYATAAAAAYLSGDLCEAAVAALLTGG